ncbi:MAG: hypothetical protein R3C56_35225 [Pirellulaceae bacterium]
MIGEDDLEKFIRCHHLSPGEQFKHQIEVAAGRLACETITVIRRRKFIDYLANMQAAELTAASLIARQACRSITNTTTRTYTVSTQKPEWQMLERKCPNPILAKAIIFARELSDAGNLNTSCFVNRCPSTRNNRISSFNILED